jgi:arginyl-tRNA synthetase
LLGQLVSLVRNGEQVRMSKRTGDMITLEEVIEEIGSDAVRYFMIEKSPDTHVEFDLDLAKKQSSENPVFYIQYAHARICSVLKKLGVSEPSDTAITEMDQNERILIFHMLQLPDVIQESAAAYAPHKVATYTLRLARLFHHFYETCPVMKAEKEVQEKRLAIIFQVREALKICLNILGVSAPESM